MLIRQLMPVARHLVPQVLRQSTISLRRLHTNTVSKVPIHQDVSPERLVQRYEVHQDVASPAPHALLKAALETYLPPTEAHNSPGATWLHSGFQHAYCRPKLSNVKLCGDGTDTNFLPGPVDIWKYRLWAGGSVVQNQDVPLETSLQTPIALVERAEVTRVVLQNGTPHKVFVKVTRKFTIVSDTSVAQHVAATRPENDTDEADNRSFLTETENICFLRDLPTSLQDERKISPPLNPIFAHEMVPNRHLLFQFSALTHNAHRIHIDPQFARREYGAKDLVVHGPLTLVLMAETLRRYLLSLPGVKTSVPIIRSIDYTNLRPLYVDQPLTICCKPAAKLEHPDTALKDIKKWQVWIQTGSGEQTSCAVKATAEIDVYVPDPDKS